LIPEKELLVVGGQPFVGVFVPDALGLLNEKAEMHNTGKEDQPPGVAEVD
jgi:hypothetical protein